MQPPGVPPEYPENPVVVRVWRGERVESVHRGAWCLVDPGGEVLASAGAVEHPFFARSSVKALQALPLFETGAAERLHLAEEEIALALASHAGEPCHTAVARRTLERLGLSVAHLRCGAHPPLDGEAREALRACAEVPSALHNNCSGKHAGFLALALELSVPPESYLEPGSAGQRLVRRAIAGMCALDESELVPAVDGCSAPTYRLPLRNLALAFARLTNPACLERERGAHAQRMTRAAARHPELIGGTRRNLDTELLRASHGRLFAKIGAEAVHAVGVVGGERALAVKIDDGGARALPALVLALLEGLGLARPDELAPLAHFREARIRNYAGLEVGRVEPVLVPAPREAVT